MTNPTIQAEDYNLTNFLFYGQPSSDATITILTGGFLHVGDILSPKIVSIAQYIAPFMGNFNPNASESSHVYYYSDGGLFLILFNIFVGMILLNNDNVCSKIIYCF